MQEQVSFQKMLQTKFTECQTKNPQFSLRAFSNRLGVSAGAVSQILNGKRFISRKVAQKICDKLLLDPQEKSEVLNLFLTPKSIQTHTPSYMQLQSDQFKLISEWHYFAILSLMKLSSFKRNPKSISQRLGISETVARESIERLIRLGLIQIKNGRLIRSHPHVRTSDDAVDISVQKSHFQSLDLARKSLEQDPVDERDFTSITMAIDSKKLSQAKSIIRKFQDELSALLEEGSPDEVYRLCVQLFPLSKGGK